MQNDPETKIISAYVEGLTEHHARNISKVLSQISKPTIIYRAGLSEDGSRAAQSHTGFLAGKKEIWNGFFKQANIIKADSLDDLIDFSTMLNYIPKISGNKIGIIAGGGAIGTELSDLCNAHGLRVPTLSEETREKIQAQLNVAGMIPKNPVDLGNPTYMMTNDFSRVLNYLSSDDNIDLIMIDQVSNRIADTDFKALVRIMKRYQNKENKPVVITLRQTLTRVEDMEFELQARKVKKKYQDLGIPVYTNFYRAVKSISRLYQHSKRTR